VSANITLQEAREILRRAVEKSVEVGWISTFVVVDEGGNVISISRSDGAPPAAAGVARAKAYLAAVTCGQTMGFSERMHAHPERYSAYQDILPRATFPGPGAMPIVKDGKVVGAFASSLSASRGGMKIEVDGKRLSREDIVTAYALQIPYVEQHAMVD
jgi:glc operon protein GlcG